MGPLHRRSPPQDHKSPTDADPLEYVHHDSKTATSVSAGVRCGHEPAWTLEIISLNINAWAPFRQKWAEAGDFKEFSGTTLILLQEHKLSSKEERSDAQEWLQARGWDAVFTPARTLESGKPSGGVAILVRQRPDVGVQSLDLDSEGQEHRLLGLRLEAPRLPPLIVACVYLQAGVGLNTYNRGLLATVAQWQEEARLPLFVMGDFNVSPLQLANSTFAARGKLVPIAPGKPTYRTSKSQSILDYAMASPAVAEQCSEAEVIHDFPVRPHSPVRITRRIGTVDKVPVLNMPPRLPLKIPFGPALQEHDWSELEAMTAEAHRQFSAEHAPVQQEKLQILDQVYTTFVSYMELQICALTDTPPRARSSRGKPPRIRWVTAAERAQTHFPSWTSLDKPLHWLCTWTQEVLRYLTGGTEGEHSRARHLREELDESPVEYRSVPALIGLLIQATQLADALVIDEQRGTTCPSVNSAAFGDLHGEIQKAIEEERRASSQKHSHNWKQWVHEAGTKHKGWAHKWTTIKEQWQPTTFKKSGGHGGKPMGILQQETKRLTTVWDSKGTQEELYDPPQDSWRDLPALSAEDFIRASRTFSPRTAQTWDGFHPRHYGLLSLHQAGICVSIMSLMERTGATPSAIRAVFAKLIPKHKVHSEVSLRSIGLMPSWYRQWHRARQEVARSWERLHPEPILSH